MGRYVTVDRQSADCKRYLSGEFSQTEVALPVPLLEGAKLNSTMTFQVMNNSELTAQHPLAILLRLFRLDLISFTVVPALIVWLFSVTQVSRAEEVVLLLSLLFLHGATFSFNDYFDHMHGRDHVNEKSGSRLIQNGAIRAHQVLKIAWFLWALAFVGGVYLAYFNPGILVFAAAGAALGAMGSMYRFLGLKSIGFSDIALLWGLGPLLTLGIEYTLTQTISLPIFLIGVVYGLLALVYSQGKNISTTMLDHQAGVRTISVRLGFDKAKTFLMCELIITVFIAAAIFGIRSVLVLIFSFFVGFTVLKLKRVKSPMAGLAQGFPTHVLRLHNIFSLICIAAYLLQGKTL